jgi:hypothetical protein
VRSDSGSFEQQVTVAPSDVAVVSAVLQASDGGMGKLKLNLSADNAVVWLDGAQLDVKAWKEAIPLRAGKPHDFRVTAPGREEVKFTVTLKAGEEQIRSLDLVAATGRLEIKSDPPGAEVRINDKKVGQTPLKIDDLDVTKEAKVYIKKSGFPSVTKKVSFDKENRQLIEVALGA